MQKKYFLVALFASAEAGILDLFKAHRPSSGFLGDVPELQLRKSANDMAKVDQAEFQENYKKPRQEKRVSNIDVRKETNTTNATLSIQQRDAITSTETGAGLKIMTATEQKETTLATAAAAAAKKADAKAETKSKRNRRGSREVTLIESLQHMGGDEAVGCVTHCRYDEFFRHTWSECLDRCVENRLMRSAMADMLPEDEHAAPAMHKEVPSQLKEQLKKHKQREEEL